MKYKVKQREYFIFLLLNVYASLFLGARVDLKDGIEYAEKMRETVFEKVFDNRFTLLFFEKKEVPHVFIQLSFNVGAGHEHSEKTYGYAHLLEHMAFKGTTHEGLGLSETDVDTLAAKCNIGSKGSFNAFTSHDSTNYFFAADATNWSLFVKVLADMMQHLRVAPDHLASEMKAVYQEIKMRGDDGVAGNIFGELLPGNHPYHHPIIGFKENVLTAHADDVRAFYKRKYRPEQAALIVVGNVDRDELIAQVEKSFVSLPCSEQACEPVVQKSDEKALKKAPLYADFSQKNIVTYKTIPRPVFKHCWIIPGLHNAADDIKASIIAFVLNDRLKYILYDQQRLVLNIGVFKTPCLVHNYFCISYMPQDAGTFTMHDGVSVSLQGDTLVHHCQATIEKELHSIITQGVTQDELDRYKKQSTSSFLGAFEECSGIARSLQMSFMCHETAPDRFRYIDLLDAVTHDDLQVFTNTYLRPFLMNTIIEKPIPAQEQQNWIELRTKVDTYDAQLLTLSERKTDIEKPQFATTVGPIHPLPYVANHPDEIITLKNGMTVYLKHSSTIPFINIFCGFKELEKVLLASSIGKKSSIPHFAMTGLWEGSEGFTKKDHEEFFDRYGAQCSITQEGMYVRCLRSDLEVISERAFHILTKPTYADEVMQRDVAHALEGIKMGQKMPYIKGFKLLQRSLFAGYPWIVQSDDEEIALLQSYTTDDCHTFHRERVNADGMFIVVVGDFQTEDIVKSLEASFGKIPGGSSKIENIAIPDITTPEKPLVLHAFLPEDQMVIGAARVTTYEHDKDMLALKMLENHTNNVLFEVRERTGIFYSISCALSVGASSRVKGMCYFVTQVAKEHMNAAEKLIKQVLTGIAYKGISQEVLDEAKNTYQNMLARHWTTQASLTSFYAHLTAEEHSFDYYQEKLKKVEALTLDEVNDVARRYLDPATWTFVQVGRVE